MKEDDYMKLLWGTTLPCYMLHRLHTSYIVKTVQLSEEWLTRAPSLGSGMQKIIHTGCTVSYHPLAYSCRCGKVVTTSVSSSSLRVLPYMTIELK